MPSAILLTGNHLRHLFVAHALSKRLDLLGVWQEEKTFAPEKYAGNADDLAVIQRHFDARDGSEEEFFGSTAKQPFPSALVHRHIAGGGVNQKSEIDAMVAEKPDVVLVYGTGILKEEIIRAFEGRILNIHLGLSPYYRGSGTNFWPLVNREPEYVGATIHYLDAGIDTGAIIQHVRPEMKVDDGPHDLGNRTIIAAAEGLSAAAIAHCAGTVRCVPQTGKGRLYQRKDFNADAVRTLYRHFEEGMIAEYLKDKVERDANISLVSL